MAIARRGSRTITVRGVRYRWVGCSVLSAARAEDGRGCLQVRFAVERIDPKQAADAIAHALDRGWDPGQRGTFRIEDGAEVYPVWQAARDGQAGRLRSLLAVGAGPNCALLGYGALNVAADHGRAEAVRVLLEHGVDPNASTLGYSALSGAANGGRMATIYSGYRVLSTRRPSDPPVPDPDAEGYLEVARALLSAGADPNGAGDAQPPLVAAAAAWEHHDRSVEMVRLLLARGADPNVRDAWGKSALWHAENQPAWDALIKEGDVFQFPRIAALSTIITLLKEAGATL